MNLVKTHKDRFLAIDANAIVHRAFHAYPPTLQTEDGLQVNAVYGFTVMLLSALKTFDPKYVVCSFDTHEPTFRHLEYVDYKATRKPTDQSLIDQFPLVEEILKAFNIPIIKKDGFEADDILGTIAKYVDRGKWSNENLELYILSGDRDLLQLVSDNVKVCLPSGGFKNLIDYDREKTFSYLGLYPEQLVDFKAIAGDSSDNIPGIKGIGTKTAQELLGKYGDLDNIYRNLKDVKPRYANLLTEGVEQAELSRKLAKIEQEVGLDVHLEESLMRDFDKNRVLEIFKKYAFKSLIPRLDEIKGSEKGSYSSQLDIFSTNSEEIVWSDWSEIGKKRGDCINMYIAYIGTDESATGFPYIMVRIVDKGGQKEDFLTKGDGSTVSADCETALYGLESIVSQTKGVQDEKIYDIGLFSHLINSEKRSYNLKDLAFDHSSQILSEKISPTDLKKVLDSLEEIRESQLQKADNIELYEYTKYCLEQFLNIKSQYYLNILREIEIPIAKILHKMESRGIKVDIRHLESFDKALGDDIKKVEKEIYDYVGHEFNINSPKQLSDVLFNELSLPSAGKKSTRESILQELKGMHPAVEKILEYRELSKMYTTYTTPILEMAKEDKENSIHTDFKQTGTTSGRFSSSNPNMQNLPIQGKWAEELRKSFIAREGFKLVGMDYSQIELRIMADMSKDNLLIKDFNEGLDIHRATASRLLNKEVEEVTKKERSLGKTVNFGILFGQTAFGLASMLGIDSKEAAQYIQSYFDTYKGVEEYIRNLEKEAYKKGYVQTMFGTTRHITGLRSKNIRMLKAAQREAVNMPIQGSEADIMKLAMIKLDEMMEEEFKEEAFTLLQIHDELIFEVNEGRVVDFVKRAEDIMKNIVSLEVPLEVNSSTGNNMSELLK
jgi:DNA polymerase-1